MTVVAAARYSDELLTTASKSKDRLTFPKFKLSLTSDLRRGHHEARQDMRRNWLIFIIVLLWVGGLTGCLIFLSRFSGRYIENLSACQPDGSFSVHGYQDFSYWSSSGFFQITVAGGKLRFTEAKAIDIVWDITFGRGGQSLIACISWRIFAQYFTLTMEHSPITFNTYRTIFLQSESSVSAIVRMSRDFTRRLRLRSRCAMVFTIATLVYILAFPTLGSAMTGYSANVEAYVPDREGNFVSFSNWRRTAYIIHDGQRISKTGDFHVSYLQTEDPILLDSNSTRCWSSSDSVQRWVNSNTEDCYMLSNVTAYVKRYGFGGTTNGTSVFIDRILPTPALNITPVFIGRYDRNLPGEGQADESKALWTWSNQSFDARYINTKGRCQTTDTYKWGFSYIQLIIMTVLMLFWSIGVLTMHLVTRRRCRHTGGRTVAGKNKAVFELAYAMQHQISGIAYGQPKTSQSDGSPPSNQYATSAASNTTDVELSYGDLQCCPALTESEIHRRISVDLKGGKVSYKDHQDGTECRTRDGRSRHKTVAWLKKERWWLTALLLAAAVCTGSVFALGADKELAVLFPIFQLSCGLIFSVTFAFFTGSTQYSRVTLFVYSIALTGIVPAVALGALLSSVPNNHR